MDFDFYNKNGDIPEKLAGNQDKMKIVFDKIALKYGITYETKFSDLKIPVVVNAGRQYK